MHPAGTGCNTLPVSGGSWTQLLPPDTLRCLEQLPKVQPVITPGKPLRQYKHGESPSAESYERVKKLGEEPRTVLLTRDSHLIRPAIKEQAAKTLNRGASESEIEVKLEEMKVQLVASKTTAGGKVRQHACASKAGQPTSKISGFSVRREGEGLAFALEGFKDDFMDPKELRTRAAATGPAMQALVEGSCMLRFSPVNVYHVLLTGNSALATISLCNLAGNQVTWTAAKLSHRSGCMAGKGHVVNNMAITVGTLYWYLNLHGMGGKMDGTRNQSICLLVLMGWLYYAIFSLAPQSEPQGLDTS